MRLLAMTLALILAILITNSAYAEDETRVGLGTGFSTGGTISILNLEIAVEGALSPVSFYAPVTFGNVRLEPEIGYMRYSRSSENGDSSNRTLQLGTGVFGVREIAERTHFYFGARIGVLLHALDMSYDGPFLPDDVSDSSTNLYIGPAIGSEYMLNNNFSLGGETQLLYTSYDDVEEDIDESVINTRATLFLRVYF